VIVKPLRPAPVAQAHTKQRILLVEDDAAVRAATQLLLSVEGFEVVAVASLREALAAVRENGEPDLLITDFHLQDGETGTAVIASLRRVCGDPLKAILVTGDTSSAIRKLPRDPNVRLASKPVEAEELLTTIRTLLGS
jgi:CheY-like chemotaxis protein